MKREFNLRVLLDDEYSEVYFNNLLVSEANIELKINWDARKATDQCVITLPGTILTQSKIITDDEMPEIVKNEPKKEIDKTSVNPPITRFAVGETVKLDSGLIGKIEKITDKRVVITDTDGKKHIKGLKEHAIRVEL